MAEKKKKPEGNLERFGDWAKAKVPILPPDHPEVRAAVEWMGQFITPKEELDNWPDNPPTLQNTYFHKKGAKKRGK